MNELDRRRFLLQSGAIAALPWGLHRGGARAERKNLLIVMADQLRWDALSCNGNKIVRTPNIDRLAESGTSFTQATCATPLCGPSRAALLTGRLAFEHGCRGNFGVERPGGLRDTVRTYDEVLKAAGYTCAYHGKWHTGSGHRECYEDGLPYYLDGYRKWLGEAAQAPETWAGEAYRRDRYTKLTYRKAAVDDMMRAARARGIAMPHHNEAGESYLPADKSLTAWTAKQTIAFLENPPKGPFSVTCSILAPHAPLIATQPFGTLFDPAKMPVPANLDDDLPERALARCVPDAIKLDAKGLGTFMALYYGLVAEIDHWVGRIVAALEATGRAGDTLIVFLADHGEMLGSHGLVSKMQFFEEAWRVPWMLSCPGLVPRGKRIDLPVSGTDLFPTVLDLCGLPDKVRGERLVGQSLRVTWEQPERWPAHAIGELGAPGRRRHELAIRSKDAKLVLPRRGVTRLYDLAQDPGEQRNLLSLKNRSAATTKRANELRDLLHARLRACGDPAAATLRAV